MYIYFPNPFFFPLPMFIAVPCCPYTQSNDHPVLTLFLPTFLPFFGFWLPNQTPAESSTGGIDGGNNGGRREGGATTEVVKLVC
jgi:hypothetical protein